MTQRYLLSLIIVFSLVITRGYAQQQDTLDTRFLWIDSLSSNDKLFEFEHKTSFYPTKEDYYVSEKYPQFKFQKDERSIFRVYDLNNNLVAIECNECFSCEEFKDNIIDALVKYDFEHNAYNINKESQAMRNYVAHTVDYGTSIKSEITFERGCISGFQKTIADLKRMRAAGRISQATLNKQTRDCNNVITNSRNKIAYLSKLLPSEQVINKANDYISQLRLDNKDKVNVDFNVYRIDGFRIMLEYENGLKVKLTGMYYNDEVKWYPTVLEK